MRILLVNPNTSTHATDALARLARASASEGTSIVEATGAFGVKIMLSPAEQAIGAHAMLEAAAVHAADCDAIVVGAFGDYGVRAAADLFGLPAISLAEAAFTTLRWLARPFSIVVLDGRLAPALRHAAQDHRVDDLLRAIHGIGHPPGTPEFAAAATELVSGLRRADAETLLLVGPPLLAMQEELGAVSQVPLLDPVACAVRLAEAAARSAIRGSPPDTGATHPAPALAIGLSDPLTRALAARRQAGR